MSIRRTGTSVTAIAVIVTGAVFLTGCAAEPQAGGDSGISVQPAVQVDVGEPITSDLANDFGPLTAEQAQYAENQDLTSDEALQRQDDIDSSYVVGDLLSPADAEFIRITANQTPALEQALAPEGPSITTASDIHAVPVVTGTISNSGSGAGATGSVSGTQTMNYSDNPLNISGNWSATINSAGSATVSKVTTTEHVRVYGLIGSSGVGLAYSADPSGSNAGRTNYFNRSASFSAYAGYWTMTYDSVFKTNLGSFTVSG